MKYITTLLTIVGTTIMCFFLLYISAIVCFSWSDLVQNNSGAMFIVWPVILLFFIIVGLYVMAIKNRPYWGYRIYRWLYFLNLVAYILFVIVIFVFEDTIRFRF